MKRRMLGRTGLDVPVLSFGASSLGSVFRDIDREEGFVRYMQLWMPE